jgi:predicted ATP-dependent endonuclease of OLD family
MELKRIKIAGFRGFNDEQEVELDGDLIIVSGDNHTGKTSLAEALEWLFFGYTVRCRRGKDQYSKIEYRDIYRNAHV